MHARADGGRFFVYRTCAVDQLLADGGMHAVRRRLRQMATKPGLYAVRQGPEHRLQKARLEDHLHRRAQHAVALTAAESEARPRNDEPLHPARHA